MPLANLITTTVTLDTIRAARDGFGKPSILSVHSNFAERSRDVSSVQAAIDLGFSSSDPEIGMLDTMFKQERRPRLVSLGRRATAVAQVWSFTVGGTGNGNWTIPINGVNFTFAASSSTAEQIRDGLLAAINGGDEPVTAAAVSTDQLTVTADNAGEPFTVGTLVSPGDDLSGSESTPSTGIYDDMAAIKAYDKTIYAWLEDTRISHVIKEGSRWAEGNTALFACQSDEAEILDGNDSTDVFSALKALQRTRTLACYKSNDTHYFDAAWLGKMLPTDPGQANWAWQSLQEVLGDDLEVAEVTAIKAKNGNWCELVGSLVGAYTGKTSGGQFVHLIRGRDKLVNEVNLGLVDLFFGADIVPGDQSGMDMIGNSILSSIRKLRGLVRQDTVSVSVPRWDDVPDEDKADGRVGSGIEFSAKVRVGVVELGVTGTLSL